MPDWTRSMQQTYEYYIVDPGTWGDKTQIRNIIDCTIVRELDADTLGSASITSDEDFSDKYVRAYLVTIQDGVKEKFPLGTYIFQTPSVSYSSTQRTYSQDGYTPLIELSEKTPTLGMAIYKESDILSVANTMTAANVRAPVVPADSTETLIGDFVSEDGDTYLTFLSDLISNAKYSFGLDELGRVLFIKEQDVASLAPVWNYTDDNSSILYPEVSVERDLYGIPNVVEVIFSPSEGDPLYSRAVNDDPASITSTVSRGREVVYRDTNPDVTEGLNQAQLDEYAKHLLEEMSALEYTITYKHGYCPVRLGDCVMLNYKAADLTDVRAKVIRQSISCKSGCAVEETAVFTRKLWR